MITLPQILELVGTLDDALGENTPRQRFRKFLNDSVHNIGAVRDYVETCLRTSGQQYCRALQDLVNHAAHLMGFDVQFGRYAGVTNEIGYDGIWCSKDLDIVVEVKTTDVYAINTATLLGYIDELIAAKRLQNRDRTLGLYLIGRPAAGLKQLEDAIVAEKHTQHLRVATISDSLLVLGELVQNKQITHDEVGSLLRPVSVSVDSTVGLIARIAGSLQESELPSDVAAPPAQKAREPENEGIVTPGGRHYLMTPVADEETVTAEQAIRRLLDSGWYVFGEHTKGRKLLKPGDRICFYISGGTGVVADAEVASKAERKAIPAAGNPEKYPWAFNVRNVNYYFREPVVIDALLRARLDAFKNKSSEASWGWFVQGTQIVSSHDFALLTRKPREEGKQEVSSAEAA